MSEGNIQKNLIAKKNKYSNYVDKETYEKKSNIILSLAMKNIKRNKNKYRITTLSIMLSVFLVLVYGSYFSMIRYIVDKQIKEETMINTKIYKEEETSQETFKDIYDKVNNLSDIKNIYKTYNNISIANSGDETQKGSTLIQIYDADRLDSIDKDKYFIGKNRSISQVQNDEGILIYFKNTDESKKINYGSCMDLKTNDNSTKTLKIEGVLEYLPYNISNEFNKNENEKNWDKVIIISENLAKKLFKSDISLVGYDVIAKDNDNLEIYNDNIMDIIGKVQGVKWVEYDDIRASMNKILDQVNLIVMIFLSFIIVIAFLNLLNIISTSILTRRQELGILKSIGLSAKKIKTMVYIEGILCTIKGSLYGSIISIIFVYIAKRILMKESEWSIPVWIYIFPIIFSVVAGYLATFIPIKKINKESEVKLINIEEC